MNKQYMHLLCTTKPWVLPDAKEYHQRRIQRVLSDSVESSFNNSICNMNIRNRHMRNNDPRGSGDTHVFVSSYEFEPARLSSGPPHSSHTRATPPPLWSAARISPCAAFMHTVQCSIPAATASAEGLTHTPKVSCAWPKQCNRGRNDGGFA